MADEQKNAKLLDEQLTAISDTHNHLTGLIEKATRAQMDLMEGGFDSLSEQVAKAFSKISEATEDLKKVKTSLELERNRLRNE